MIDEAIVQQDTDAPDTTEHEQQQPLTESTRSLPGAPHEARKYRKRAQVAEQALESAQNALEASQAKLRELERTITDLERRAKVDQLLAEADAIDLESARLLTEMAVSQMDEPDVAAAVADLKRRKPALFRAGSSRSAIAQGARPLPGAEPSARAGAIATAAAAAHSTGSRADLLRYLRLKRKR